MSSDVIELTQLLVRTPSPVRDGDERAVAALIQDTLAEFGLPAAETYALSPERPNLVTTIDFGPGGRHLALVGHIDTKPVGEAAWTVDPFAADIDDDRLYGLGSADMKGAVAAMLIAARNVAAQSPGAGRLSLVFTADEEDGAVFGARHLASVLDHDFDALVIGEPSGLHDDFDSIPVVSRGLGRFRITAHAVQGHSSLAALLGFRNAGVDLARGIVALTDELDVRIPANVDELPHWGASVNPALVYEGGYGYGVLPEWMSASVEVRTLPGMTEEELLEDIRSLLNSVNARTGSHLTAEFEGAPRHWIQGTVVTKADPVVQSVQRAVAVATGAQPPVDVFPGTTDTSWFAAATPDLPCLPALGPGLLHRCHAADEWVSVEAVRRTVPMYEALVRDYCAPGQEGAA